MPNHAVAMSKGPVAACSAAACDAAAEMCCKVAAASIHRCSAGVPCAQSRHEGNEVSLGVCSS